MTQKLVIILLTWQLLASCSTAGKQERVATTSKGFRTLDTTIHFAGYWLSEAYFNSINKDKSPKKAQEGSEDCFIVIPDRTLKKTMMIWNFHEGSGDFTVLKNDDKYQLCEVVEDGINPQKDIEVIAENKIKIGNKFFVKITPYAKADNASNPLILEAILFSGKYQSNSGTIVEFKNNGQVTGLGNYQYYEPLIDYMDAGLQVDQVRLGESEKKNNLFGFKFKLDTLLIYQLNCIEYDSTNQQCGLVDYGQLKYKLVRAK